MVQTYCAKIVIVDSWFFWFVDHFSVAFSVSLSETSIQISELVVGLLNTTRTC